MVGVSSTAFLRGFHCIVGYQATKAYSLGSLDSTNLSLIGFIG